MLETSGSQHEIESRIDNLADVAKHIEFYDTRVFKVNKI
jgi:hypothetical protein